MANIYNLRKEFQYNLESLPNIIQRMVSKLINESEDVWKLLNNNEMDALNDTDLTPNDKLGLIEFKKKLDDSQAPFKLVPYMSGQVMQNETTEIRMYPYNTDFVHSVYAYQSIRFEIITHYNNYRIDGGFRLEVLKQELIKVLNNFNYDDADGVLGEFTFDNTNARLQYYTDSYVGYALTLRGDIK